jgi:hypothetical protein
MRINFTFLHKKRGGSKNNLRLIGPIPTSMRKSLFKELCITSIIHPKSEKAASLAVRYL